MFNIFRTLRDARDNERRLGDVQDALLAYGFMPGHNEEESDTVARALDTLATGREEILGKLFNQSMQLAASRIGGKVLGAALAEQVNLRLQLLDEVDATLQVARGVKAPNGTTKKLDRMLTEALAAQPRPIVEESVVEADEDTIRDIEADVDEVPADDCGPRDLDQDAGFRADGQDNASAFAKVSGTYVAPAFGTIDALDTGSLCVADGYSTSEPTPAPEPAPASDFGGYAGGGDSFNGGGSSGSWDSGSSSSYDSGSSSYDSGSSSSFDSGSSGF